MYKYGNSSCTVTHMEDQLLIEYDGSSDVMFNSVSYNPSEVRLFKPSLHKFNGTYADAELVVVHNGTNGGFIVCVPFSQSAGASASMGSTILEAVVSGAKRGESVSLNVQDFNLNHIIPKSGYYSYTGSLLYGECNPDIVYNYVVFPPHSLKIPMKPMAQLGKLIHNADVPTVNGDCYWNEKGTMNNGFAGEGQIYIDCQPTDEDGEIVYKEPSTSTTIYDFTYLWKFMYVIVGMIVMYFLVKLVSYAFTYVPEFSMDNKMSSVSKDVSGES
jgi:hypothetical protein